VVQLLLKFVDSVFKVQNIPLRPSGTPPLGKGRVDEPSYSSPYQGEAGRGSLYHTAFLILLPRPAVTQIIAAYFFFGNRLWDRGFRGGGVVVLKVGAWV